MKNLFLSFALLVVAPTFSSQNTNSVEKAFTNKNVVDASLFTVCVNWTVTDGPWPNDPYFYTRECAEIFQALNGGTIVKGTYCVDEEIVFICL